MRSPWIREGLKPQNKCLYKRQKRRRHTDPQERGPWKTEEEVGVMYLQAKERQGNADSHQKLGEVPGTASHSVPP